MHLKYCFKNVPSYIELMKVGFYIHNKNFSEVDCRKVKTGNPGIGGTWMLFLIVASELAIRKSDLDITLFVQCKTELLPCGPEIIEVRDSYDALETADKMEFDYLVFNLSSINWDDTCKFNYKSQLKLIPWCHNFSTVLQLEMLANNNRVCRIVNVSREQMDLYRDHPAFAKMDYIYNCVPFLKESKEAAIAHPFGSREHVVTYIGSLVPEKSFHVLASIWPAVLKVVPDAQVYIIGNGSLYRQNAELGKYRIAEKSYEARFMRYLADGHGEIIPSVHFMGKMGKEKNNIILKSKVGVPNPTGNTETFCLSAVEMQYGGCAVSAMSAPGYYDTFVNGEIVSNKRKLVKSIVRLLLSSEAPRSYTDVSRILENKFGIEIIVDQWEAFFLNGTSNKQKYIVEPIVNGRYRLKWLKERLRILKLKHPPLSILPCVEFFLDIKESIIRKFKLYARLD